MKKLFKSIFLFALMFCVSLPVFSKNAIVTYSKGKVEIDRGNGWVTLNVGDEVSESDILSTGFKSEVRLNYNGSLISLAALTRITFTELKTVEKKDYVDLNVSMGAVRSKVSRVDRDPPDYRARTSVAVASVRGTDFTVFSSGKILCKEGKVAVMPVPVLRKNSKLKIESEKKNGEEKESENLAEQLDFDNADVVITANQEVSVTVNGKVSKPVAEAKKKASKAKEKIKTAGEKLADSIGKEIESFSDTEAEIKFGSIEIDITLEEEPR